jgi:cold shock CspA family protein
MTESVKVIGRIIKVSDTGWGFISSKDIKFTRIFFHWTHLRQDTLPFPDIRTGMMVEFTPLQLPGKGYRAVHIRVIDNPTKVMEEMNESAGIESDNLSVLPE